MIPIGNRFIISQPSADVLKITSPYLWWVVAIVVLFIGLPACRSFIVGIRTHRVQPFWWSAILAAFLVIALTFSDSTGTVTIDKASHTVTFDKRGFLFIPHHYQYPLDQVRYATLETQAAANRFVILFKGGARIGLSAYSSAKGQSQAVEAVNQFLGVYPTP